MRVPIITGPKNEIISEIALLENNIKDKVKCVLHNVILDIDIGKIRKLLEDQDLTRIVNDSFIQSLDLTIQRFKPKSIIIGRNRNKELEIVLGIPNSEDLLLSEPIRNMFVNIILDDSSNKKFISCDNFYTNMKFSRIATKDFRVLVDDLSGKVPPDAMLNCITVASLMLTGTLDYTVGYDYIVETMKRYGYTNFVYQEGGYLHINLGASGSFPTKFAWNVVDPKS